MPTSPTSPLHRGQRVQISPGTTAGARIIGGLIGRIGAIITKAGITAVRVDETTEGLPLYVLAQDVNPLPSVNPPKFANEPDPQALTYRLRGNRSLSKDAVVAIDRAGISTFYSCESQGWTPIPTSTIEQVTDFGTCAAQPPAGGQS